MGGMSRRVEKVPTEFSEELYGYMFDPSRHSRHSPHPIYLFLFLYITRIIYNLSIHNMLYYDTLTVKILIYNI